MPWDDDFLGARASRPHKAWHSFAYLPHFDQPGTAPLLSFDLADAVPAEDRLAFSVEWPGWPVGQGLDNALA